MKKVIITTGALAVAGGLATVLFMPSCGEDCEVADKPSIILQFVGDGDQGAKQFIAADSVLYNWTDPDSGDKLDKQPSECLDDDCTEWGLGEGEYGTFEYTATVCGQEYRDSLTVELDEDGCVGDTKIIQVPIDTATCPDLHPPNMPESQVADEGALDVNAKACTLEARPSVIAHVIGEISGNMVPIHPDRVFYVWDGEPNGRAFPGTCIDEDCAHFSAGLEQTGGFTIGVEVCGEVSRTTATVAKTADGCHVATQQVRLEADLSGCDKPPAVETADEISAGGEACPIEMWPSAILFPVTDGGDVWLPHPTEDLVYIHDDTRHRGYCVEDAANGKCLYWITGWNRTGRFRATTETCDRETEVLYSVEPSADGCHPVTEYVPVFVDTTGCLTPATPKGNPPTETASGADSVTN